MTPPPRPHAPTILADPRFDAAIEQAHIAIREFSQQLASVRTDAARFQFLAKLAADQSADSTLPQEGRDKLADTARRYREMAWSLSNVAATQEVALERVRALVRTIAGGEGPSC
jgi:hypothetical protein